jgi:hypothetical protein
MDQLQRVCGPVLGLLREWRPPLLADEASIAELLDMVDGGKPEHHVLASHAPHRFEVKVAEARMPSPRAVAVLCCQTHRSRNL